MASHLSAPHPSVRFGRRVGQVLFACWVLGVVGVLAGLAKTACEAPPTSAQSAADLAQAASGWRVQHWLPSDHDLTPLVARMLLQRGPRPGLNEEICVNRGESVTAFSAPFSNAGWKTVQTDSATMRSVEPQLRLFSPEGVLVWRGSYRAAELKESGAALLDDVVLLRLVRGEIPPHWVPVGCTVALPRRTGVNGK